jgi:hypothetical protein
MIIRSRAAGARRGSALVLSLIAVTTVVVLSASFSQFASAVASRQAQAVHRKRAFYVAEGGLAEAFSGVTCGKSGNVGTPEAPALLGDGVFWVEATELSPGVIRLQSTGMIGTARVELAVVAERGVESIAALGLFSGGAVSIGAGSLLDGYDSTKGDYSTQTNKTGAAVGSNEGIAVTGTSSLPTTVKGNVTPGTDDAVTTSGTVTITGSKNAALSPTELPAVEVPELSLGQAQVHASPYPLVIPAGVVGYQSLTVASGAQVIIQGPAQVVLGSLSVQASAQLSFDTSQGAVELFVTDALDLATQSLLTSSSTHPEQVTILVAGETASPVALRSSGPFHGVVYAPEAPVIVGSSFELFGALVTDALTFEGSAKVHFDRHLAALAADAALPHMLSWRIVELSSTSTDLAMDPFDLLGLDKNLLPDPSEAHADQTLMIDYFDPADVYHRYVGPESAFDWTVVKTVIFATRDGVEVMMPRSTTYRSGTRISPGVLPVVDGPMI